jgi:DNA topoisomerase-2
MIVKKSDEFKKVSNLAASIQETSSYLHGSIEGVLVNMAKTYVNAGNNIPLVEGKGSFGDDFVWEAAATRYIQARKSKHFDDLFNKEDWVNLLHQTFEGEEIEPKFFVPVLPLVAINGSEGLSVGYAQKILPRSLSDVLSYVNSKINGNETPILTPHYNGQKFVVEQGETHNQWIFKGIVKRISAGTLEIQAIPLGYDLATYKGVLDKLEEDKVIKSYDDLSDGEFKFLVKVDKSFADNDEDWILTKLKLIKKVSENYTCIDENNRIVEFNNISEVVDAWYKIRLEFNDKRKISILNSLKTRLSALQIKLLFITLILKERLVINNKTEDEIVEQLSGIERGDLVVGNLKELLNIPVRSLTLTEKTKLEGMISEVKSDMLTVESMSSVDFLKKDLEKF